MHKRVSQLPLDRRQWFGGHSALDASADVCNIVPMELPDIGRYRRRFIVEFGPEDSGLIDRMGIAHRTKRAAIIAGLRLLESGEVERLRAQVANLETELTRATADLAAAKTKAGAAKPDLAAAKADLKAERDAHRATKATLRDTKATLTQAQNEVKSLRGERDSLAALLPHHAACRACDKLVPAAEWADHETTDGVDVYHKNDGYRAKGGLLGGPSTVLLQRRAARQAVR